MSHEHQISLAIITHNSEATLGRVLSDVENLVSEIILVDDQSRDRTLEIAKGYGAKIFDRKFDGFASQKQFAIDQCSGPWILLLDDDEYLDEKYHQEIRKKISEDNCKCYNIPRTLFFMNKIFKIGSEHKVPILRLFKKGHARMNDKNVHEGLISSEKVKTLKIELLHESFSNYEDGLFKMETYANLWAEGQSKKVKKWEAEIRSYIKFFETYLLKLNFLNGRAGKYWANLTRFYQYKKYTYLYLKNKEHRNET